MKWFIPSDARLQQALVKSQDLPYANNAVQRTGKEASSTFNPRRVKSDIMASVWSEHT